MSNILGGEEILSLDNTGTTNNVAGTVDTGVGVQFEDAHDISRRFTIEHETPSLFARFILKTGLIKSAYTAHFILFATATILFVLSFFIVAITLGFN